MDDVKSKESIKQQLGGDGVKKKNHHQKEINPGRFGQCQPPNILQEIG